MPAAAPEVQDPAAQGGEWPVASPHVRVTALHPHNGKDIPIFVTDNFDGGKGGPKLGDAKAVAESNGVTYSVKSSKGFEDWLASLTPDKKAGSPEKNLVLLFGSATDGYSDQSWEAMKAPLLAKFDELDNVFGRAGWILVTNGDGDYEHKAIGDIAMVVAERGTPVIFVQSDYGAALPEMKPKTYWPTYACGGLFGKGVDHQFAVLWPKGNLEKDPPQVKGEVKEMKHCWGGIAKQGWLGDAYPTTAADGIAKAIKAQKEGKDVTVEGSNQTVEGGKPKYAFPDKAFLVGCPKLGHFKSLRSMLREVLVAGGGLITKEQITMYKEYVSLLIETTSKEPEGKVCETKGVALPDTATRCTADGACTPPTMSWVQSAPPADDIGAQIRFRGGAKV